MLEAEVTTRRGETPNGASPQPDEVYLPAAVAAVG